MPNYICAVDIGSSQISGALAVLRKGKIAGLFADGVVSKSVKQGVVVDPSELSGTISALIRSLRQKSEVNIRSFYTAVSGRHVSVKASRAVIPLAERGNKVINISDIRKVDEQARVLGATLDEEILHALPVSYAIDSKSGIYNPCGLYSHRLEAELCLICAHVSFVESLGRIVNQCGCEMEGVLFSGLASAEAISGGSFKDGISVVCDVGSDVTELLVFQDGILKHIEMVMSAGNDLTSALADHLKIPFELAEEVKKSHAAIGENIVSEDKQILIKRDNLYTPIKQRIVAEVITAEASSLCRMIRDRLEAGNFRARAGNFFAIGRTVLSEGFLEILENTVGIPVKIGRINNPFFGSIVNSQDAFCAHKYLAYVTAIGVISSVLNSSRPGLGSGQASRVNLLSGMFNRVKEVYQEYF